MSRMVLSAGFFWCLLSLPCLGAKKVQKKVQEKPVEKAFVDHAGCHWPNRGKVVNWNDAPASELPIPMTSDGEDGVRRDCFAAVPQTPNQVPFYVPRTAEEKKLRCDLATWVDMSDDELDFYYDECTKCKLKATGPYFLAWYEDCKQVCGLTFANSKEYISKNNQLFSCYTHAPHLRLNFRRRLKILPPIGEPKTNSALKRLANVLGKRQMLFAGDSTVRDLFAQLDNRARSVGADIVMRSMEHTSHTPKSDRIWYNFHSGPSDYFEHIDPSAYLDNIVDQHGAVLFASVGVHWNHADSYARAVHWTFNLLETFLEVPRETGSQTRAFFLEVQSQHFPTNSGGFCIPPRNATLPEIPGMRKGLKRQVRRFDYLPDGGDPCWQRPNDKRGLPSGYLCSPLGAYAGMATSPECADAEPDWRVQFSTAAGWRNEVIRQEALKHPRIEVIPLGALTAGLWDMHLGSIPSADCTHWCNSPALIEASAHLLMNSIERKDQYCTAAQAEVRPLLNDLRENIETTRHDLESLYNTSKPNPPGELANNASRRGLSTCVKNCGKKLRIQLQSYLQRERDLKRPLQRNGCLAVLSTAIEE